MEKDNQLQQISQRAQRLFAKESYAAAKKEFERIASLSPNRDIRDKILVCEKELFLQQRKDQIKKGRRLEKKGDLASALDCFTRASSAQTEPWLEDKIAQLRQRLETSQVVSVVEKAAEEEDLEKRLQAYDLALAHGSDTALREKRTGCLIEMGRYGQAIDLYTSEAPQSVQGRYDFGYALIACGRYLEGLTQWEPLFPDYPALFPQITTFLPYLARELAWKNRDYALPYRILSDPEIAASKIVVPEITKLLDQYRRYFQYCFLKECWYTQDYASIPALLPSQPRLRDAPLLARLYLNLAEIDINYLKPAITYWLTAIHNRKPSDSPHLHQAASTPSLANNVLPSALFAPLEEQIAVHTRAGRITPELKAHWQTERRQIEHLAAFLAQSEAQFPPIQGEDDDLADSHGGEYLPCTPAFAREFGFSDGILRLLRDKKNNPNLDEQDRLDLHAAYSPLGQYMDWIEPGDEDKVFNALPKSKNPDRETQYLHQRIALRCGINRIHAGGRHTRKFFQAALPILEMTPRLPQELIDLAYGQPSKKVLSSLSEAMEFLSRHLKEPRFLEATAHCIGLELQNLLLQGVSVDTIEKRLDLGIAIYPDCQQIQTTRAILFKEKNTQKISKALRSGNLPKAARITRDSQDPEMENLFFDAMATFHHQLSGQCEENEINAILNRLYEACCIVDEQHWVTEELATERSLRGIA